MEHQSAIRAADPVKYRYRAASTRRRGVIACIKAVGCNLGRTELDTARIAAIILSYRYVDISACTKTAQTRIHAVAIAFFAAQSAIHARALCSQADIIKFDIAAKGPDFDDTTGAVATIAANAPTTGLSLIIGVLATVAAIASRAAFTTRRDIERIVIKDGQKRTVFGTDIDGSANAVAANTADTAIRAGSRTITAATARTTLGICANIQIRQGKIGRVGRGQSRTAPFGMTACAPCATGAAKRTCTAGRFGFYREQPQINRFSTHDQPCRTALGITTGAAVKAFAASPAKGAGIDGIGRLPAVVLLELNDRKTASAITASAARLRLAVNGIKVFITARTAKAA